MATYLLTGGCGFIGSHLADALLARGDQVRVIDDLSTGRRVNLDRRVEVMIGNVCDQDLVASGLSGVAGCFHLAAVASVERSRTDWLGTHRINQAGAITIFDAVRRAGLDIPVVYASSAAVYGDATALPVDEAARPRPLSAYGADKLGCELHGRVAFQTFGIRSVGLRLFNVFGSRQDPHSPYSGVISIFLDRICGGRDITIFGDGCQSRDFIHVSDVVAAFMAAMDRAPADAAVYNVCTGQDTTLRELVRIIGQLCGREPQVTFAPPRTGDIVRSVGDSRAFARDFGIRPEVSVEDGLRLLTQVPVFDAG